MKGNSFFKVYILLMGLIFICSLLIGCMQPEPPEGMSNPSQNNQIINLSEWEQYLPQNNTLNDIWGSSPNDVFVVGDKGAILHYNGNAWIPMESGTDVSLQGIWGSSSSDVFVVGEEGTIMHYDGNMWNPMESGKNEHIIYIGGSARDDVVAITAKGSILIYDGIMWNLTDIGLSENTLLWDAWCNSSTEIVLLVVGSIISDEYRFVHYDGIGSIPKKCHCDRKATLMHIWGSSPTNIFAAGDSGIIVHFDGTRWSTILDDFPTLVGGGWANSPSDVFIVGWDGVIAHYDSEIWRYFDTGISVPIVSVWGSIHSEAFAITKDGTILHYTGAEL